MPRTRGEPKKNPEISIPLPLLNRARRAAHWLGYKGDRDFSAFMCLVLDEWLNQQAARLKDKDFPEITPIQSGLNANPSENVKRLE